MSDPRIPQAPAPRPSPFGRLWRLFLPVAIAIMGLAVLTGIADPTGRPAWMFGAGIFIAVIGVASLFRHLIDLGRRRVEDLESRFDKRSTNGRPGAGRSGTGWPGNGRPGGRP